MVEHRTADALTGPGYGQPIAVYVRSTPPARSCRSGLVKVTDFVVGLRPEHVPVVREVRKNSSDAEKPPNGVPAGGPTLTAPAWLVEVERVSVADPFAVRDATPPRRRVAPVG